MSPEKLIHIFKKLDLGYIPLKKTSQKLSYLLHFALKSGMYNCYVNVNYQSKMLFVNVDFPVLVTRLKINDAAVYLSYLNKNLSLGCWELDPDSGYIKFRSGFIYDESGDSFENILLENLYTAINVMDECAPGIMRVISTHANPREVFLMFTGKPDVSLN